MVLALVVMPFFLCSTQLLAPTFPGAAVLERWHRRGVASQEEAGPSNPPTWLQRPGLVRLDPRSAKKRRELVTACVLPAVASKVEHTTQQGRPSRHVSWRATPIGPVVTFDLVATQVAGPVRRTGRWGALAGQAQATHRVEVSLHSLVHFMSLGEVDWQDVTAGPDPVFQGQLVGGQDFVVMHLGECDPRCCCPWHLRFGGKAENKARGERARKRKGVHCDFAYPTAP